MTAALGKGTARYLERSEDEYATGDKVRLTSMGVSGKVTRRLDVGRWEVQVGAMRMKVASSDLVPADSPEEEAVRLPDGVRFNAAVDPSEVPAEINVIGKTADQALSDVDRFLDRAVVANRSRLRVIHGFGKDVLRRELWQMFARHVHVTKYYQAEQHEGGAGATIVEVGSG